MKKSPIIFILINLFILLLFISCETTYAGRLLKYGSDFYGNSNKLPNRIIAKADQPFFFQEDPDKMQAFVDKIDVITWMSMDGEKSAPLEDLLRESNTRAFLVIKDDVILYEKYLDNTSRETLFPTFSVSKSVTSLMVGNAIEEGLLPDIEDPVRKYIPEFIGDGYDDITVKHLLFMNAGFEHSFGLSPADDLVISSIHPKSTELAFEQEIIRQPGESFEYNNYNTLLLGMILQNLSGMTPSEYLEKNVWKPMGAEFHATWNLNLDGGFEYMGAGLNVTMIDLAKIGRLYLNKGMLDGIQILSPHWIALTTSYDPSVKGASDYYNSKAGKTVNEQFKKENFYSGHWWGVERDGDNDFFAVGMFGQYIYVCPEKNMIVLRLGSENGDVYWWPHILRDIIERSTF